VLKAKPKKPTPLQKLKLSQLPEQKPKASRPKQKTLQELRRIADEEFSRYIRLRDSEWKGDAFYGKCISCSHYGRVAWYDGKKWRWSKGWDAGHYVLRGELVVRFDERNVNLQCNYHCNRMKSGNPRPYRLALMDKYGTEVPDELTELARNTDYYKFSRPELLGIIESSKEYVAWTLAHPQGLAA
jgi:hypothetical protein